MMLTDIRDRLIGRVLADPIPWLRPDTGRRRTRPMRWSMQIVACGRQSGACALSARCLAQRGVCRKCYGRDLAAGGWSAWAQQ